jgi:hypothetical protein
MKKETKYIDCPDCYCYASQEGFKKTDFDCKYCKNFRMIPDPKEEFCNMCGECMCIDVSTPTGRWKSDKAAGLHNVKYTAGYESYHLFDCITYTFSLCEKCLRQLFFQCKIKPAVSDIFYGESDSYSSYDEDQIKYEYRVWKDTGGHHNSYMNATCNAIKDCENKAEYSLILNVDSFTEDCFCEEHKDLPRSSNMTHLVKFIPNVLKLFL